MAPNTAGSTPLHWACTITDPQKATATLQALLGAEPTEAAKLAVNVVNREKETVRHYISIYLLHRRCVVHYLSGWVVMVYA